MKSILALRWESHCLLLFGFIAGAITIAVVPPIVTFDGPSHFFRALQISHGELRPTRYSDSKLGGSISYRDSRFVNELWDSYWDKHSFLTPAKWVAASNAPPGADHQISEEFTNTAVYSPVNYLPQSLGMVAIRMFSRSPLAAHRAACISNLMCYLLLVALTLEVVPHCQSIILLVASSPLILIQASTENIDGVNYVVPMLLLALVWSVFCDPLRGCRRRLIAIQSLSLVIALLKPTEIACLFCLLFLPQISFGGRLRKLAWVAITLSASAGLWFLWNNRYFDVNIAGWFDRLHPPVREQEAWLLRHPMDFVRSFAGFISDGLYPQWGLFFGGVGGWIPIGLLYFLLRLSHWLLGILLLLPLCDGIRNLRWSMITFAQAAGLLLFIALTLWISYGTGNVDHIPYLGGRYLFLVYTFALISWSGLVGRVIPFGRNWLVGAGIVMNAVGVGSILLSIMNRTLG